jgi:nicotinate dehydrogenase subunit A
MLRLALARLYANGIIAPRAAAVCSALNRTMSMTQTAIRLTVNGRIHDVDAAPDTALLYVLRNDLALNGPKFGCGLGECGACTVIMDGVAARSCVIPVGGCVQRDIVTTTKALLMRNTQPSEKEIREALRYNLCRCGAHVEIVRAALRAAGQPVEAQSDATDRKAGVSHGA